MRPRRVFGYARVSSAEQALGTSLQDQQDLIRAYAQKRGLNVTRIYVEAESAVYEKAERRAEVQALLADSREGDLVLVDKIDRWSRDPEFTFRTVRELLAKGAGFFAIGDDCDPSTPHGDTMLNLRVLFAREEHKRIKLRMVGTRKLLKDRGYYAEGLPPTGYRRQGERGPGRNVLVVEPGGAEVVRDVFARCIAGESLTEIARAVGWERSAVHGWLQNRVYLGEVRDGTGNWHRGKQPPIVDPRTFAEAQASLERRRNGQRVAGQRSETASWWLRRLAVCGRCGAKMSAAYAGPHEARRYYYFCFARCTRKYVPVALVEDQASGIVLARLIELRGELARPRHPPKPAPARTVEQRRERLEQRRARVLEAFMDGALGRDAMRAEIAKLDQERTRLDAIAYVPPPVTRDQRRAVLLEVDAVRRAWSRSSPAVRARTVYGLATAALLEAGKPPRFDWIAAEELARRA